MIGCDEDEDCHADDDDKTTDVLLLLSTKRCLGSW